MLRILLLVLIGVFFVGAAVRAIASIVIVAIDIVHGAAHAPENLGTMTGSILVAMILGWLYRKIYFSKRKESSPTQ